MQPVDADRLNQLAEGDDERLGNAGADDRADDFIVIIVLVDIICHIEQFVQNVNQIFRHTLTDTRTRIFCGYGFAYENQTVNGQPDPFV